MPYEQLRYFQLVEELDDIDTAVSVGPIASESDEIIEDEAALAFERQPMIGAHCSAMFKSTVYCMFNILSYNLCYYYNYNCNLDIDFSRLDA